MSNYKPCNKFNNVINPDKRFGSNSSNGHVDCNKCGETGDLSIVRAFKDLYEDKMKIIDKEAGGDNVVQAKIKLQQDWIRDLTDQNEMLVRVVEELEQEATQRVNTLEDKLKTSSQCACEVMNKYRDISVNLDKTFQSMEQMQSDIKSLVEFIRRIRDDGAWTLNGLGFYHVNPEELMGQNNAKEISQRQVEFSKNPKGDQTIDEIMMKDNKIRDLECRLNEFLSEGLSPSEAKELRQSMLDMRDSLTAEVADKHDMVLGLRRDLTLLEEQLRKADQQTHFKDDIIKELRREIKQLKQEIDDLRKKSHTFLAVPRSPPKLVSIPLRSGLSKDIPTKGKRRPKSASSVLKSGSSVSQLMLHENMSNKLQSAPRDRFRSEEKLKIPKICPISTHRTIETYNDSLHRVVIFVCEDLNKNEVHKVFDGVGYKEYSFHPKVVHECTVKYLEKLKRNPNGINHIESDASMEKIYDNQNVLNVIRQKVGDDTDSMKDDIDDMTRQERNASPLRSSPIRNKQQSSPDVSVRSTPDSMTKKFDVMYDTQARKRDKGSRSKVLNQYPPKKGHAISTGAMHFPTLKEDRQQQKKPKLVFEASCPRLRDICFDPCTYAREFRPQCDPCLRTPCGSCPYPRKSNCEYQVPRSCCYNCCYTCIYESDDPHPKIINSKCNDKCNEWVDTKVEEVLSRDLRDVEYQRISEIQRKYQRPVKLPRSKFTTPSPTGVYVHQHEPQQESYHELKNVKKFIKLKEGDINSSF